MEAHDLGYRFTPDELIQLHDHGVDGKYLRTIHDSYNGEATEDPGERQR